MLTCHSKDIPDNHFQENARAVITQAAGVMLQFNHSGYTIADPVTRMMPLRTTIKVSVQPAMRLLAGVVLHPRIQD